VISPVYNGTGKKGPILGKSGSKQQGPACGGRRRVNGKRVKHHALNY